jgi:hypothetical protein
MNTVVIWVLMSWTGHADIPTIEFNSKEKCEKAADIIYRQLDERTSWGHARKMWCARIEK